MFLIFLRQGGNFPDPVEYRLVNLQISFYRKNHILCYVYFYDTNPYFKLNAEVISRLNVYGIDLEFDIYCLAH